MFLEDRFVYVDLNKTGTVTVLNALSDLGFKPLRNKHHAKPSQEDIAGRAVFATIRDPWSYYLSLWGYGVKHGNLSGPYRALTEFAPLKSRGVRLNPVGGTLSVVPYLVRSVREDWTRNHADFYGAMEPDHFRRWLRKVMDPRTAPLLSGAYSGSSVSRFAGLYTYRYCNLLCMDNDTLHSRKLRNLEDLKRWEADACYVDRFIQTENLNEELSRHLQELGLVADAGQVLAVLPEKGRNVSVGSEKNRNRFYTPELVGLVAQREQLLIDKFGYSFDA